MLVECELLLHLDMTLIQSGGRDEIHRFASKLLVRDFFMNRAKQE